MKNTVKVLVIIAIAAVIGFSMAACNNDDDGSGGLTITGIPATYNGKYALAKQDGGVLIAAKSINRTAEKATGGKIEGGSVTLNVYTASDTYYTGSEAINFDIAIVSSEEVTFDSEGMPTGLLGGGAVTVNFASGVGSGTFVTE